MQNTLHGLLKILSQLVMLLMLVAIVYAAYTGIRYWTGIGV